MAIQGGRVEKPNSKMKLTQRQKDVIRSMLEETLGSQERNRVCERLDIEKFAETCKHYCEKRDPLEFVPCTETATKDGFCRKHYRNKDKFNALQKYFSARDEDDLPNLSQLGMN